MNLFLVENDHTIDIILALPEFDSARDTIICFNYLPYVRLERLGAKASYCFVEDLFTRHDYRELHAATDRFAAGWYHSSAGDETVFRGISYGAVTEITLARYYLMNILVKYGEALRIAVNRFPRTECIFYDFSNASSTIHQWQDDGGRFFDKTLLVHEIARQTGRRSQHLAPRVLVPPRFVSHIRRFFEPAPGDWAGRAKHLLKRITRTALNACSELRHGATRGNIYFFVYFNLASVMDHARPGLIVPTPIPRYAFAPVRYLDFLDYPCPPDPDCNAFLARLRRCFLETGDALKNLDLKFNGVDYSRLYARAIKDLVEVQIPDLCAYAARVAAAIRDFDIRTMVHVDLLSEMGKIHAAVCRSAGVKVIFVDHGIMGTRMVQRGARAAQPDTILKPETIDPAQGPYPYDMSAPAVTLGNPTTDPYPASKRKAVKKIRKVLLTTFADNFYGRLDRFAWQEAYFKELLAVIEPLASHGIEIHYRSHSENDAYCAYLFDFFGVDPALVKFSPWHVPFRQVIREMDLLVCSISNVFYEAQAAGVPTIFLDPHHIPDAMFPPFNGGNWKEVIRAGTGRELVEIILRNRDDPAELNGFLERFLGQHARAYMHALDGRAGERIMHWLFSQKS